MPDVQSLIESARAKGLRLSLADGKVKVQAPQALDGNAKALLQELREHREEVKKFLNESDPILTLYQWYPDFRDFHHKVIAETVDFENGWLRVNRPDLFQAIKAKENELDSLQEAKLSEVMSIIQVWRELVLKAEFERERLIWSLEQYFPNGRARRQDKSP